MATVGSGFTGEGGGGVNSPSFKQKALPWAEVVRGEVESSSSVAAEQAAIADCSSTVKDVATVVAVGGTDDPSHVEGCDGSDAVLSKKPVWNKVANGGVEVVGPVMGAASWPALSEAAKVSSRSVVSDSASLIPVSNGVIPTPQVPAASNAPQTQVNNSNPNPTPRHAYQGRPRPMRRGPGGGNGGGRPAQGGFVRTPPPPPPPPPPFPLLDFSQGSYVNFMPVLPHAPPIESPYSTRPVTGFAPPHPVNTHFSPRNPPRRPRGENPNSNNPGGRSDHERTNPELNSRGSNGRDMHMQHPRAPPPGTFLRHPPPGSPTFITPPLVGPFAAPMPFNDMRPSPFILIPAMHSDPFSVMPFFPHEQTSPAGLPVSDNTLPSLLLNQINFYFSEGNLERDDYLRSKMDADGWVPIAVIAGFPRVKQLTNDTHVILEALQPSAVVEVKDGKVRKRNDWKKYTLLPIGKSPTSNNELTKSLKKLELEEGGSSNQSSINAKEEPTSEADPIRSSVDGSD